MVVVAGEVEVEAAGRVRERVVRGACWRVSPISTYYVRQNNTRSRAYFV